MLINGVNNVCARNMPSMTSTSQKVSKAFSIEAVRVRMVKGTVHLHFKFLGLL